MSGYYITIDGDVLDKICHRHYGASSPATEIVLENNPGLAQLGDTYPYGIHIYLPDIPSDVLFPRITRTIRIFDTANNKVETK